MENYTVGIRVHNLCRSFGAVSVLRNMSMTANRGQIYGLLGPSGCGKTTLLKVLLGKLTPDSGEVLVLGIACSLLDVIFY